jgi:hypothetical protein
VDRLNPKHFPWLRSALRAVSTVWLPSAMLSINGSLVGRTCDMGHEGLFLSLPLWYLASAGRVYLLLLFHPPQGSVPILVGLT